MAYRPTFHNRRSVVQLGIGVAASATLSVLTPATACAENAKQAKSTSLHGNGFYRFK